MMRGTSWLLVLVVATARGVGGVTDGAGCGATCGERVAPPPRNPRDADAPPTPPPFPRKPRDAADAPPRRASVAVVGGGPGGALAALLLARQERLDVTLYEKELDVGSFERRSYSISIRDKGVAALREAGGTWKRYGTRTGTGRIWPKYLLPLLTQQLLTASSSAPAGRGT